MQSEYVQQRKEVKKISPRPTSICLLSVFFSFNFFFFLSQFVANQHFASASPLPESSQAIAPSLQGRHTLGVAFTPSDIKCPKQTHSLQIELKQLSEGKTETNS